MDVDCRLDGSAQCWRMLQQECRNLQPSNDDTIITANAVTIESTKCLGPCGDGPNVVIVPSDKSLLSSTNRTTTSYDRIWDETLAIPRPLSNAQRYHKSFVPAYLFGANVQGVYQVRDSERARAVVHVAVASSLGTVKSSLRKATAMDTTTATTTTSNRAAQQQPLQFIESRRCWFDRPRNERLVAQRVLHASILYGLATASNHQPLGTTTEWGIAIVLWTLSNFVMKESVLEQWLQGKLGKRR
jgi:(2Fe-2S) ferredoxin